MIFLRTFKNLNRTLCHSAGISTKHSVKLELDSYGMTKLCGKKNLTFQYLNFYGNQRLDKVNNKLRALEIRKQIVFASLHLLHCKNNNKKSVKSAGNVKEFSTTLPFYNSQLVILNRFYRRNFRNQVTWQNKSESRYRQNSNRNSENVNRV